jgi:hypothetical protein
MAVYAGPDIVENGLVLHLDAANRRSYPGTGTGWFDLSGSNNHFQLFNSPTFNVNKFIFDGLNDYARSINTVNISNTNNITVEYIFNPLTYTTGSGTGKVLMEATTNFNSNITGFYFGYNDTGPGPWPYDISVNVKGNNGYNINAWDKGFLQSNIPVFFTAVLNKSLSGQRETILYTNGIFRNPVNYVSEFNNDNTNNFGNDLIFINGRNGSEFFGNIEIYSIKIYNRVLSTFELQQNFNALRGRFNL